MGVREGIREVRCRYTISLCDAKKLCWINSRSRASSSLMVLRSEVSALESCEKRIGLFFDKLLCSYLGCVCHSCAIYCLFCEFWHTSLKTLDSDASCQSPLLSASIPSHHALSSA